MEKYFEKLIVIGSILGDAARERIEMGDISPKDLKLISSASYTAGFIEAMKPLKESQGLT